MIARVHRLFIALLFGVSLYAESIAVPGVKQPVEVLRDRWGVPHIYAQNTHDLFFAQGYVAALDRLWQIDLWRRVGTGKLAEVLGPSALRRDRLARAVQYRGDWEAEWRSYGPETKAITTAFTDGINAYILSLGGKRPPEFRIAGYDPGLWVPEDCVARVAGLLMTRNLTREVARVQDARRFGLPTLQKYLPPDPAVGLEIPRGLDLHDIFPEILADYNETIGPVRFAEQGSNNWVVDGSMTATGKPILSNDPHRPIQLPSLRKTVHLVAPGWNAFGAGEPALPGIALGHNDRVAFGFTIVGIDQVDLYVEKINPSRPDEYLYKGSWRKFTVVQDTVAVKGRQEPETVELRYSLHGPIIHEDRARNRAYALRWVGAEPGSAGYLAALSLMRARNWSEFRTGLERYKVPSENLVYADVDGNIGWQAGGLAPVRKNWSGLFPVPGDTGEYEWNGFRAAKELPFVYNPREHFVATANHNILPPGYSVPLGYEWALPFRFLRIKEMLSGGRKFTVSDFERMQQDVTSLPARRFQGILRKWDPPAAVKDVVTQVSAWNAVLSADSATAAIYEAWITALSRAVFGPELGARVDLQTTLQKLEAEPNSEALTNSLDVAITDLENRLGKDRQSWSWGQLHRVQFRHPVPGIASAGEFARPGDGNTVNATSGSGYLQTAGASYRQIIDVSDWDKSVMTNTPGESGNPDSPHYADLAQPWSQGKYHPMPFSRKAVEAATEQRFSLVPSGVSMPSGAQRQTPSTP
jgi:penicillin G amidase